MVEIILIVCSLRPLHLSGEFLFFSAIVQYFIGNNLFQFVNSVDSFFSVFRCFSLIAHSLEIPRLLR